MGQQRVKSILIDEVMNVGNEDEVDIDDALESEEIVGEYDLLFDDAGNEEGLGDEENDNFQNAVREVELYLNTNMKVARGGGLLGMVAYKQIVISSCCYTSKEMAFCYSHLYCSRTCIFRLR